jgi:hypothetical protein
VAVNDLTLTQVSTVLNDIVQQATGKKTLAPQNTSEFITVANTALKMGYDPLLNSITQVLSKTIFSIRPYYRKFAGINVSNQKFGNITRKLNISDKDFQDDSRLPLTEGQSVDMYQVCKPTILQTNFYGANMYQKCLTIFKDQLDTAFTTPDEFGRFITMTMQNATDMIEQAHETLARSTIANFIGGILAMEENVQTVHLIREYNAQTGQKLTEETVYAPDNFTNFMKFVVARVKTLSDLLTERSIKYHVNVTGKEVSRHTPKNRQKMYLSTTTQYLTETNVLSDLYNEKYMKLVDFERVNFWQSIDAPGTINITPIYMKKDGSLTSPDSPINNSKIFGVIFDEDALGYTTVNQWSATTPFNARGGYSNIFWHFTDRYWNDFTENGIVLLLD